MTEVAVLPCSREVGLNIRGFRSDWVEAEDLHEVSWCFAVCLLQDEYQ